MSTPTRADFTAALNTVEGITGSDYRVEPAGEGNAWVNAGGWENDGSLPNGQFMAVWLVTIVLPQEEQAADLWWDNNGLAVIEALRPLMFIESAEPVVLETNAGDLFARLITGRSE